MTTEQEMIQALEMLMSEVCQDNYHSSTSVAAQVIKGFGLTQKQFLEYFGFGFVNITTFSRFRDVFNNLYICLTRDNWFYGKEYIIVYSMSDINKLIGMYKCISKFLGNTKHFKHFPGNYPILHFSLSDNFIIDEDTAQSTFVDYKYKFGALSVIFNKTDEELPNKITNAFNKAYTQYFRKISICWNNKE